MIELNIFKVDFDRRGWKKASQRSTLWWTFVMIYTCTETWARKEAQAQRQDGGKGVSSPHLVEKKETQGNTVAPVGGIPPGRAFHDPVKCGRPTGFCKKCHALLVESPGREVRQLI